MAAYGPRTDPDADMIEDYHASLVAAAVVGRQLGVAKRATVWAGTYHWTGAYEGGMWPLGMFRMLELFVKILERVSREGLGESSVINMSFVVKIGTDPVFHHLMVLMSKSNLPNTSTFPTKSPHDAKVARGSAPADNVPAKTLCELAELGVVIVASAGNDGNGVLPREMWPQFLADPATLDDDRQNMVDEMDESSTTARFLCPFYIPRYLEVSP